jgi:hypothetical protein
MSLRAFTIRVVLGVTALAVLAAASMAYALITHSPGIKSLAWVLAIATVLAFLIGSKDVGRRVREQRAKRRPLRASLNGFRGKERLVALAAICEVKDHWSANDIELAREELLNEFGRVPTVADLATHVGDEAETRAIAHRYIRRRKKQIRANSRCHICNGPRSETGPEYEFGLAQGRVTENDGGSGILTNIALNAVTLPFGAAASHSTRKNVYMHAVRLRLLLCDRCASAGRSVTAGLGEGDCKHHPYWELLAGEGYFEFIGRGELEQLEPVGPKRLVHGIADKKRITARTYRKC